MGLPQQDGHTPPRAAWAGGGQAGCCSGAGMSTGTALGSAEPADGSGDICWVRALCLKTFSMAFPSLKPSSYCAPLASVCC